MKITVEKGINKEPVNIFKKGNLVSHKDGTIIIVTKTSLPTSDIFAGFSINNLHKESDLILGYNWYKDEFTLFTGKVTLENDIKNL